MPESREKIGSFIVKRTPSLERIERFRAIGLMFEMDNDAEATRDMQFVVETFTTLRRMQGRRTEPKLGGMDRPGIP